jgi:hypothetical protein
MTTATKPQIRPFREIKGDELTLNLHSGQTRVHDSKARFPFLLGGTQLGKTCYAPHWLEREIRRKGAGDYLAVTATFPLLNLKLLPEMLTVFQELYHYGEYSKSDKTFYFHQEKKKPYHQVLFPDADCQTRIIFGSATNPESIESATAKAAVMDEVGQKQFRRDAWEATLRRLSLAQGRALGLSTLYTWGWLKTEVFDEWEKGNPDFDIIQVDSIVNPAFPLEEYERARHSMPDWKFQMFYRGRYAKPAGMIYDCFDSGSVVEPFSVPENWHVYVGHDFGTVNMAGLWVAQDPTTGYLYIFKEYLDGGKATWEHVDKWREMSSGLRLMKRVGGATHEEGWRGDFSQAGWMIHKPSVRDVEEGIQRVYGLIKTGKLFICRNCLYTLDEIQSYSYELDENYLPTGKIADKERYHIMDALRYVLSDFLPVSSSYGEANEERWD